MCKQPESRSFYFIFSRQLMVDLIHFRIVISVISLGPNVKVGCQFICWCIINVVNIVPKIKRKYVKLSGAWPIHRSDSGLASPARTSRIEKLANRYPVPATIYSSITPYSYILYCFLAVSKLSVVVQQGVNVRMYRHRCDGSAVPNERLVLEAGMLCTVLLCNLRGGILIRTHDEPKKSCTSYPLIFTHHIGS